VIYTSNLPTVEIPDSSLTDFVLNGGAARPDRSAFVDGATARATTYAEFAEQVRSLAGGFVSWGLEPGDVVALMAPNSPEYGVVFHAVAFAGGIVTTINPTYTPGEVAHQLADADAKLVVTTASLAEAMREMLSGSGVEEVLLIDDGPNERSIYDLEGLPLATQVPVSPDDVVALPYSSGTTGLSKGVMLTHRNLVANVIQSQAVLEFTEGDSFVAVLPFFHIYGMQVLMNLGLAYGATIVTMPRFELEQFLALHEQHGLTRAFVAPPMVVALAKHPLVDSYDLSTLDVVFSGAAPLSAELANETGERLGCQVVQGYGMTELSPISHATPAGGFVPGSVGIALPDTEVRIVDPLSGDDVDVGGNGEVWVRGPQVMKGYLNNPIATSETVDGDGWLKTGDVGHIDEDGHLFVVDRLKELIKYKGFQVPPAELEALLLTHPAVSDAAVIGVADEEAGELPTGFVVLRPDVETSADDLMAYVAERVAHYKQVRDIHFVEEIPKSASGKILRRVLRDGNGRRNEI
jgi:4-coumarate--CoA ligase